MTLFAFHTNKKQYLDTLHVQNLKEIHHRVHNNEFDILLKIINLYAKVQIPKFHKDIQNLKCNLYYMSWVFRFSYQLY